MTRRRFDQSLAQMHRELLQMGALIEEQIQDMIIALQNQDKELAAQIIKRDDQVDTLEEHLEKECIALIAKEQPLARDLRTIASVLKIITDLERIADHCSDIAQYTIRLADEPYMKPIVHIPQMAEEIKAMVSDMIHAYITKDVALAQSVIAFDDVIDRAFDEIVVELGEKMKENSNHVNQGINLIFITKYLERMADHASNVCHWIIYHVTGELDQHSNN
ncbi:phosphate signaling complex protein PhoU [Gottschalkiaceae bacterium SANA]|nr:phosphate signaling complex protein PhoU [Gottschalkiaceae bacterium SANA]